MGTFEQRLELIMQRQNSINREYKVGSGLEHHISSGWLKQPEASEASLEEDIKTPDARPSQHRFLDESIDHTSSTDTTATMRGFLPHDPKTEQSHAIATNYFSEKNAVRCFAMIMHHGTACLVATLVSTILLCYTRALSLEATLADLVIYVTSELHIHHRLWHAWCRFEKLCEAAPNYDTQRSGSETLQTHR